MAGSSQASRMVSSLNFTILPIHSVLFRGRLSLLVCLIFITKTSTRDGISQNYQSPRLGTSLARLVPKELNHRGLSIHLQGVKNMDLLLRTKLKSLEVIRKPLFWTAACAGMTEKGPTGASFPRKRRCTAGQASRGAQPLFSWSRAFAKT